MKPRHAAALALVGWYLIVPPKSCKRAELDANFSLWKIYNSYDMAAQCRAARDDLQGIWVSTYFRSAKCGNGRMRPRPKRSRAPSTSPATIRVSSPNPVFGNLKFQS